MKNDFSGVLDALSQSFLVIIVVVVEGSVCMGVIYRVWHTTLPLKCLIYCNCFYQNLWQDGRL